jgi:putative DNA primase/helicase
VRIDNHVRSAENIARHLAGRRCGNGFICKCPVHDDRSPSLSLKDGDTALLIKCFAGCSRESVLAELRRRGLLGEVLHPVVPLTPKPSARPATPSARALEIWRQARSPIGTVVEAYLKSRKLELPTECAGDVIRFHSELPWLEEATGSIIKVPAMVTAMRAIVGNNIMAVHCTRLNDNGQKVGRKMRGRTTGTAVKLDDDAHVEQGVCLSEGIESGLAGRRLGYRPCWACGSANGIEQFPVLPDLGGLTLLAEHDPSSRRAIEACLSRWRNAGIEVIVVRPKAGKDVNDAIRELAP